MLRPGDVIEQYVLARRLQRDSNMDGVQTWYATDNARAAVVLKIYIGVVHDDYGGKVDLGSDIARMVPLVDTLISIKGRPGIASWTRYHHHSSQRRLILCRQAYADRFIDRVFGDERHGALVDALGSIAQGIDTLVALGLIEGSAMTAQIKTNNLLMNESSAVIADFGKPLQDLERLISSDYGPRLVRRQMLPGGIPHSGWFSFPELYYFMRTKVAITTHENRESWAGALVNPLERDILQGAFDPVASRGQYSCAQLIAELSASGGSQS